MAQGIYEQIGPIAAVEPEAHFVQVGRKMLRTDFMPSADDAALRSEKADSTVLV